MQRKNTVRTALRGVCLLAAGFTACSMLSGCLIAGFSSGGGDGSLLLPGGIGLLVLLGLLLWLVCRHRW